MLCGLYENIPQEIQHQLCEKQSYISLGLVLAAAAELKIDATPMDGFENGKIDDYLNLHEMGLKSTVILALGYRDSDNDWAVNLPKYRTPKEEFIIKY